MYVKSTVLPNGGIVVLIRHSHSGKADNRELIDYCVFVRVICSDVRLSVTIAGTDTSSDPGVTNNVDTTPKKSKVCDTFQ